MPCELLESGQTVMVLCHRRPPEYPGCRAAGARQCDYPVGKTGRTCDRYTCPQHCTRVGFNRDYCWLHARAIRPRQPQKGRR